MAVFTMTRVASVDEIVAEMDRRGAVIEKMECEKDILKCLVKDAYNEGFIEGMREESSCRGGKPWRESNARAILSQIDGEGKQ